MESSVPGARKGLSLKKFSNYIVAMIPREEIRASASPSVSFSMNWGHMPKVLSTSTMRAAGMMKPVNGMAIRFVSRKCCGNELK